MADLTIKEGDVVTLKSHSNYKMTVENVYDGEAQCVWFHPTNHDIQRVKFSLSVLTKLF